LDIAGLLFICGKVAISWIMIYFLMHVFRFFKPKPVFDSTSKELICWPAREQISNKNTLIEPVQELQCMLHRDSRLVIDEHQQKQHHIKDNDRVGFNELEYGSLRFFLHKRSAPFLQYGPKQPCRALEEIL